MSLNVSLMLTKPTKVYSANITHNLNEMAEAAGIYMHLWRPDNLGVKEAGELIEPLRAGLELLKSDPERFKAYDAPNGWGRYEHLVSFVAEYLAACEETPGAAICVSR